MKKKSGLYIALLFATLFLFGLSAFMESSAWARAGGGGSSGSRGSRSFSAPSAPPSRPSTPSPSPGVGLPGRSAPGTFGQQPSTGGAFSRSPFLQGMAGGLAGGLLGNMLFGGSGHAGPMGAASGGGGGIGFMDILILGLLAYFGWKFFKRRKAMSGAGASSYERVEPLRVERGPYGSYDDSDQSPYGGMTQQDTQPLTDVDRGFAQISRYDPAFNEETFKESAQDMFFRIQAGWMNRTLEGIENLFTPEMTAYFTGEFEQMKQQGRTNRLENIAVRKVEPSEVWQESGRDYVTVFFTANLLDYTVDDKTGQVVQGDRLNPVKFQEFWTFCRDVGSSQWKLSGINQVEETSPRFH